LKFFIGGSPDLSLHSLKFVGSFFPKDPLALHHLPDGFATELSYKSTVTAASPVAIIAPHAAYQFSGKLQLRPIILRFATPQRRCCSLTIPPLSL
jgi:AmmeMemoRadiSam system protein B